MEIIKNAIISYHFNLFTNHCWVAAVKTKIPIKDVIITINACQILSTPISKSSWLNKKTIGFYPNKRTSTSLRWQTINDFEKKLNFTDIDKMSKFISIDLNKTILEIQKFISSI